MIQLVAFLGNCGREYAETRHNVAWLFAESLPFAASLDWQRKFKGLYTHIAAKRLADVAALPLPPACPDRFLFIKPETYMNLSGESIAEIMRFFRIEAESLLVVHDELELPLGTVSLKWSGGLGGHNGLRSTRAALGTADFWRLRFGIGRPAHGDVAGYVLSPFLPGERLSLDTVFAQTARLFGQALLSPDPRRLVSAWGKKKVL